MIISNIDNPDFATVASIADIPETWDGDFILIQRNGGGTERKQYHKPVAATPQPASYKVLSVVEFEGLIEAVSQMNDAQYMAWEQETDPSAFRFRSKLSKTIKVDPNDTAVMSLIDSGLDTMVALGHTGSLPTDQFKAAILANLPTE